MEKEEFIITDLMKHLIILLFCIYEIGCCQTNFNIDTFNYNLISNKNLTNKINNYKQLYSNSCLQDKITNNFGDGYESLYGTRNFRVVLHGIAYRGGANNYYHKSNKRDNKNPLPIDGLHNLLSNGFSSSIYLYPENFDTSPSFIENEENNIMNYYQIRGDTLPELDSILNIVYNSIIYDRGPVYLHCWNGWHQSGYISAILLKQFCDFDSKMSISYWESCADSWTLGYDKVRDRINNFKKIEKYRIPQSLSKEICPCNSIDVLDTLIDKNAIEKLNVSINFPDNSADLAPSITTFLDEYSKMLKRYKHLKIGIKVYSCSTADDNDNILLSETRASNIFNYLVNRGIDSNQLFCESFGEKNSQNKVKNDQLNLIVKYIEYETSFEDNGFNIPLKNKKELKEISNFLNTKNNVSIIINGYADKGSGNNELNEKISLLRAQKVGDFFDENNFKIEYNGFGSKIDKYGDKRNRRVELKVTYD